MPNQYLIILFFLLNGIFCQSNISSNIIILSTANVHGEIDPCG